MKVKGSGQCHCQSLFKLIFHLECDNHMQQLFIEYLNTVGGICVKQTSYSDVNESNT